MGAVNKAEGMLFVADKDGHLTWISPNDCPVIEAKQKPTSKANVLFRDGTFYENVEFTDDTLLADFVAFCAAWQNSNIHRIDFPE